MYIPAHFEESRPDALHDLIAQNPFGTLVTHGEHGLDANHIPFLLLPEEGKLGVLHAHVARANPVWKDVANGDDVLVIFRAGDAYISPTWYPSKHEAHRQVPTWNYRVAHAHGGAVRALLARHQFEAAVRRLHRPSRFCGTLFQIERAALHSYGPDPHSR